MPKGLIIVQQQTRLTLNESERLCDMCICNLRVVPDSNILKNSVVVKQHHIIIRKAEV